MADFQLPVEVLVNVAATGGEAGVICGKKDEEITLDELRRLHAAVEDEIAKESGELEEFLCQKVRPLKSSNEVKDAIEISGKIGVLAEDLDLAAEHCRDRIEALRNIRDDHHGIIAEVEDYMVMCAVLEKFRNLSNCVDSLSRKISLLNCVETLEGAKKLVSVKMPVIFRKYSNGCACMYFPCLH